LDKLELNPSSPEASVLVIPDPVSKKEAFVVPTDVSYTAVGLNIAECNNANSEMTYSGKWLVAGRVLSYDYLWQRVRVIGGAYGTGFSSLRTGACRFYSYRDPHIDQTLEAFKEAGQWLSNFDASNDEFEGYVVSTVSSFDSPLKPRELTKRQDSMFLSNYTQSERLKTRSQIVNTSIDDVRALGGAVSEIASSDYVCTVGSLELINSAQHDFNVVELLA
jgi:Zn-dependent M16 (insulinase) family peptidase